VIQMKRKRKLQVVAKDLGNWWLHLEKRARMLLRNKHKRPL
jgi:hypothetical protein